ncbi:MAG TPA: type II secretion system F family protein [Cytophagaceae bacterium]
MAIDISKIKTNQRKQQVQNKEKSSSSVLDFLNKDISLFGTGLKDRKKEAFYTELSILLSAGVDIRSTLEMIASEQSNKKDAQLFTDIKDKVIAGSTLSEALKETSRFSAYEYFSLQIGEETGKLTTVLRELGEYYQKKIKQRRQITGALTYPMIVLVTSFGAIFFMLNFIVPMFSDVFKRFGGELPYITALIVKVSTVFSDYFYLLLILIASAGIFIFTQRANVRFRKVGAAMVLKLPLIGEIIRKIYLARFCHSMTLLIGAKIPIIRALGLVKQMIGFYPIEVALPKIEEDIMQGVPLNQAMAKFGIFPRRMTGLLKVGEEVNQLEQFFDKIAKQYSDEVEHQTGLISSMIEPFMIIFLGLIVGVILIAMYLPLFQLSTTF